MSENTLSFAVQTHSVQIVVPSEMIKRNIKIIQRQIEKTKKQVTEEIEKIKKSTSLSPPQKLDSVRKHIKAYEQLNKKLTVAVQRDQDYRLRLSHRIQRLTQLEEFTVKRQAAETGENTKLNADDEVLDLHNEDLISWCRDETDLLILDYLLKSNVKREANFGLKVLERLSACSSLPFSSLIDHDIYTSYNEVYISISQDHDLEAISTWYNDNKAALKKIGSNLLFEIYHCKYLSLIEHGDPLEAIAYSKKNLAPYAKRETYSIGENHIYEQNLRRLIQLGSPLVCASLASSTVRAPNSAQSRSSMIASLLSYSAAPDSGSLDRYVEQSSEEHWRELSQCFTRDFTKVYGIPHTYPLFIYLSAGLSSLKTKSCFCNNENTIFDTKNGGYDLDNLDSSALRDLALRGPNQYYKLLKKTNQCPVCSPELFQLSRNLPHAQLTTSIYNNPFKLPNGNIYPFDKLLNPEEKYDKENLVRSGKIRDPLTHEIFFIDECIRVYPA